MTILKKKKAADEIDVYQATAASGRYRQFLEETLFSECMELKEKKRANDLENKELHAAAENQAVQLRDMEIKNDALNQTALENSGLQEKISTQ